MLPDVEIAQNSILAPIFQIAASLGVMPDELLPYGTTKAKISDQCFDRLASKEDGKLILVTAVNPTPAGEGKTTMSIGLADALHRRGKKACLALREPSLGPVFGIKGGATGGGYSQVLPMEDINLHFTGDFHAITSANNLLAALIDNHIFQGNELGIDENRVLFRRCLDMNDRALRRTQVECSKEGKRTDGFQITAASEIMATFCLARDLSDLKRRLGGILVAFNVNGDPVYARDLHAEGAMTALLRDALMPNLVQTIEHTPALVHGGPFANIAHGCNSVRATRLALKLADFTVTEAGFGSELGAEKFMDIKCRALGRFPDAVVLVVTLRALKYNGGVAKENLKEEDPEAVRRGLCNLAAHLDALKQYDANVVVCINNFPADSDAERAIVTEYCEQRGVPYAFSAAFLKGGAGAEDLAKLVISTCEQQNRAHSLYELWLPLEEKIRVIAQKIYGADDICLSEEAKASIAAYEKMGVRDLPVCIAKTQYSLSDDPKALGRPEHFTLTIRDVALSGGAGFFVCYAGSILTMPGFPRVPAANAIDVDEHGVISGLF